MKGLTPIEPTQGEEATTDFTVKQGSRETNVFLASLETILRLMWL
jgi:hypothetical protein